MGGRAAKGEWTWASTSADMILFLSAQPIVISAHALIHADSLRIWEQMVHRTIRSLFFSLSLSYSHPPPISPLPLLLPFFAISSFTTDYAFVEIAVQAFFACPFPSRIFSICSYVPIWCSLSLGWEEPQGQLGAPMPTGIPIMLPKARPW